MLSFIRGFLDVRRSIKAKIFVCFTIAIGTITVFISLYWYREAARSALEAIRGTARRNVQTAQQAVDNAYEDICKMHATLVYDTNSLSYILRNDYSPPEETWFKNYSQVLGNLNLLHTNLSRTVSGIGVFKATGETCLTGTLSLDAGPDAATARRIERGAGADMLFFGERPGSAPPGGMERYVFIGRAIFSLNEPKALLVTKMNTDFLAETLRANGYPGGFLLLLDQKGGILFDSAPGQDRDFKAACARDRERIAAGGRVQGYMFAASRSAVTGFWTLCAVPYAAVRDINQRMRVQLAVILCAILVVVAAISMAVSSKITRGLQCLTVDMMRAGDGDFAGLLPLESGDEVGRLSRTFVDMIERIRGLMENIRSSEIQKREMEIKVLRAQISPHFLYNSLNTIQYLARLQNAENIQTLTASLIDLLQGAVRIDDRMIPMEEELRYVRSYMNIQQYRSPCGIRLDIQAADDALRCCVPKMILQPIVENALIHGLGEPREGSVVRVRAWRDGEELFITVTDNGVGMTQERIREVLAEGDNRSRMRFSGIGVGNVDRRIKMQLGDAYGLAIYSQDGLFTTVEIRLPVTEGENHEKSAAGGR